MEIEGKEAAEGVRSHAAKCADIVERLSSHSGEVRKFLASETRPPRRPPGVLWPVDPGEDNPYAHIAAFGTKNEIEMDQVRGFTVAIFGLGGLGAAAAESIARCGFKKLLLFDKGIVRPCDLHSMLFSPDMIGWHRTEACEHVIGKV